MHVEEILKYVFKHNNMYRHHFTQNVLDDVKGVLREIEGCEEIHDVNLIGISISY